MLQMNEVSVSFILKDDITRDAISDIQAPGAGCWGENQGV